MGHYRSEMGYEAEDERIRKLETDRRRVTVEYIKRDIEMRSIEEVLADIVLDPLMYRIRAM